MTVERRTEFHPMREIETEGHFVQSVHDRKGQRLPAGDVNILANNPIHGMTILYVYDPETGALVGQQWTLNVERT